jgi:16S rRNA (cytosine967-C5)-methyltransferase
MTQYNGRLHIRHRNLARMLEAYLGDMPLPFFLKEQFRLNKAWGSSDRKYYRDRIYEVMRLGNAVSRYSAEESLQIAALLRGDTEAFAVLSNTEPDNPDAQALLQTQFPAFDAKEIFPFPAAVSSQINQNNLFEHHREILPVYARILPKAASGTMVLPDGAELLPHECLRIPAGTDLSAWTNSGFLQVQDFGSQEICRIMGDYITGNTLLDMCSGAGGKSLWIASEKPEIELYCSDIRENITDNLKVRFEQAGFPLPAIGVIDFAASVQPNDLQFLRNETPCFRDVFDCIVADLPCSGSGTWGRAPEMLRFFTGKEQTPDFFSNLQRSMVHHAWPLLNTGATFLYITCSVYACENEANTRQLAHELHAEMLAEYYTDGFKNRCDYLYIAVLKKR